MKALKECLDYFSTQHIEAPSHLIDNFLIAGVLLDEWLKSDRAKHIEAIRNGLESYYKKLEEVDPAMTDALNAIEEAIDELSL